jgi:high-affinity nickel-transport protein
LLRRDSLFVGGWFALGHSTIVCVMCIVVAVSSTAAASAISSAGNVASIIGTSISFAFLTIICIANTYALVKLFLHHRRAKQAGARGLQEERAPIIDTDADADALSDGGARSSTAPDKSFDVAEAPLGGCFTRCCPRLLRSVDRAYKMYFVGFVFGLGFDTSSEVSLLAISVVTSMQHGGSPWFAILLAFLFTSSMTLIDTIDGMIVRWAFESVSAERRLLFNVFITAMATGMAVVAATVQLFSLVADLRPEDESAFLTFWRNLDTTNLGFVFIGLFVVAIAVLAIADWRREAKKKRTEEATAKANKEAQV